MYFWSIGKLKDLLVRDELSEKNKFWYYIITASFFSALAMLTTLFPLEASSKYDKIGSVFSFAIGIIGIISVYKMNGGKDGKEFLSRILSLNFILTIRCLIFLIGFFILFHIVNDIFVSKELLENFLEVTENVFLTGFEIVFFWRLAIHMRDVRNGSQLKPEVILQKL